MLDEGNDLWMVRIIDEDTSEADGYLYPAAMFAAIELLEVAGTGVDGLKDLAAKSKHEIGDGDHALWQTVSAADLIPILAVAHSPCHPRRYSNGSPITSRHATSDAAWIPLSMA